MRKGSLGLSYVGTYAIKHDVLQQQLVISASRALDR